MAAKWMNEGENRVANILFGSQPVDGLLHVGLYKNSSEPAETATLANLDEVSGPGYARKALTRGAWVIVDDLASYAQQTFTATGNWGDVYGYFLTTAGDASGKLLAIDHFEAPLSIESGKGVKITPKVQVA